MSKRPSPMFPKDRTRWCWYGVTAAVPSACFTQAAAPRASPRPHEGHGANPCPSFLSTHRGGSQISLPSAVKLAYHASDETGGKYGSLHEVWRRITRYCSVLPKVWTAARYAANEPRSEEHTS